MTQNNTRAEYMRQWRKKNPEYMRQWCKKNPDKWRASKSKYGKSEKGRAAAKRARDKKRGGPPRTVSGMREFRCEACASVIMSYHARKFCSRGCRWDHAAKLTEGQTEKQCAKCGVVKPVEEFYFRSGRRVGARERRCKACHINNGGVAGVCRGCGAAIVRRNGRGWCNKACRTEHARRVNSALVEKRCARCGKTKPINEFSPESRLFKVTALRRPMCYACVYSEKKEKIAAGVWKRHVLTEEQRERYRKKDREYKRAHMSEIVARRKANPKTAFSRRMYHHARRTGLKQINTFRASLPGVTKCYYCGEKCRGADRHIDHVIPLSMGGTNDPWNLVVACAACNLAKHDKDVNEFSQQQIMVYA